MKTQTLSARSGSALGGKKLILTIAIAVTAGIFLLPQTGYAVDTPSPYPTFQRDAISYDGIAYNTDFAQGIHYPVENRALSFNGTGYVSVNHNPTLNPGTGSFTVSAWIKPKQIGGLKRFIWKNDGTVSLNGYYFMLNASSVTFGIGDGLISNKSEPTGQPISGGLSVPVQTGKWYFVTGVRDKDSGKVILYIDGQEVAKIDDGTAGGIGIHYNGPLEIGGRSGSAEMFNGTIDDVSIYNRALTPEQIMALKDNGPDVGDTSLKAYYSFDNGTAEDKANDNDGVLYGGVTPTWRIQSLGETALTFNGVNSYIDCGNMPSLNITGNITVSEWVKLNDYTDWGSVFSKLNESQTFGYGMELTSARGMKFWIGDGDWLGAETEPLALDTWYHITGTYDGTNIRIYLDGELAGGPVAQGPPGSSVGISAKIGRHGTIETDPKRFFNGVIDEVIVYDRALNELEIESLMTNGPAIPDANLVVYYSFAEIDFFYPYTIDGYITRYRTGEGINGIDVRITGGDTPMNVILPTRNDESGNPGYYKVNMPSGSYTIEASKPNYAFYPTFQRDAISYDGITYNTAGFTPGIDYPPNKALMFNGSGYIDCASDNASLNITSNVTVAAWIKISSRTDWGAIFNKAHDATLSGYGLELHDNGTTILFGIGDGDWQLAITNPSAPLELNTWYHVVGTYDGTNIRVYLNGDLAAGPRPQGALGSSSPATAKIGRHSERAEPGRFFNGVIDEVVVYDRALNESEIESLMTSGPTIPDANLKAHYSFDGGTAKNEVSGNDGVLYGGVTPTWRIQSLGEKALAFNGLNNYIDCGTMPSLNITGNITVAAWIKISSRTAWGAIFNKAHDATLSGYGLELHDNGTTILFGIGDGGGWQWVITNPSAPLELNTWYHVVGTYDGTYMRVYLNGNKAAESQPQGALGSSSPATAKIGRHSERAEPGRFFNGVIDEVVVYDRALTEPQIESLMVNGPAIPDANLVVYYSFDVE